jgi:large repetitive protein
LSGDTFTFAEGSTTFKVNATDAAGNEVQSAATRTFTVDTTAPDTTITDGPSGTVNSASATFEFSSTDAGSTFECSLDGATFAACDAPRTLSDLYTFFVRAKDAAGNTDASPATQTWTVDTTPVDTTAPTVTAKTPTGTGVARNTNVSATFSESMDEASIEAAGTVKLVLVGKRGKTTPVAASVTYNPATKTVTLDPATNLRSKATYTATITTAAKDEAGNALAQPETWTFTTARR